jgi:hypothetical protein
MEISFFADAARKECRSPANSGGTGNQQAVSHLLEKKCIYATEIQDEANLED